MVLKILRGVCCILLVALLTGCDPEALVTRKVPDGLKSLLRSEEIVKAKRKAQAAKKAAKIRIQVLSPQRGAFCPAENPVDFVAKIVSPGVKVDARKLTWTVQRIAPGGGNRRAGTRKGPGRPARPQMVGRGPRAKSKLAPGRYRVTLTLALADDIKVTSSSDFLVAPSLTGSVLQGKLGLPGVTVTMKDASGKTIAPPATTRKDGRFRVEKPDGAGPLTMRAQKEGYAFDPPYFTILDTSRPPKLVFHAAKARLGEIRLMSVKNSQDIGGKVCPGQDVLLKASVSSETPLTEVRVFLVPPVDRSTQPLPLASEATDQAAGKALSSGKVSLRIKIPVNAAQGVNRVSYGIRLTCVDAQGHRFSFERPGMLEMDNAKCVMARFNDAVAAQKAGKLKEAVRLYDLIEGYHRNLDDPSALAGEMEKVYFDRGLAHLGIAMAMDPSDELRPSHITEAMADFKKVLQLHSKDAQAYLFQGLARWLKKDYDLAIELYTSAIFHQPEMALAYKLRGLAYLDTRVKRNLAKAVDDFTQALTLDPKDSALRKTRRAVLLLDVKTADVPKGFEMDTSGIRPPSWEKGLELSRFCRG